MPLWLDLQLVSVLNGLAIGSLLFVVAVGLSIVFGTMDVLNLAHGALFSTGSYLAWRVAGESPTWAGFAGALAVAALCGGAFGALLSRACDRLSRRSHLHQALLTLGVALVIGDVASLAFGNDVHSVNPPPGLDRSVTLLGHAYPLYRLCLIGAGLSIALGVHWAMDRTLLGALVRATVADREMVAALGIDERRVKVFVFAFGALLASVAGVLGAPIYGARPGLDFTILVLALVVVVIGGLGSVRGALIGALVIGQIETLVRAVLSDLASFVLFGALALVLIVRPRGLVAVATGSRA